MKDFNIVVKFSLFKRLFFIRGIVYFLLEVRIIYMVFMGIEIFIYIVLFYVEELINIVMILIEFCGGRGRF